MWVTLQAKWIAARPLTLKHLVNFTQWAGLVLCQICGFLLNDRIPLSISRRRGGAWHLEYRLYPILLVAAASPIGFGIFGAGVQYGIVTPPAYSQLTIIKIPSPLHGSGTWHLFRRLRGMLQYSHNCELRHRMFQDFAARGRRSHECLSTDLGPCSSVFSVPLGRCRECWLVGFPLLLKRLDAHQLTERTGFLG